MKSKKELIKSIQVNEANLLHIAKTGVINGSLLLDIEKAMDEYAKQKAQELLNQLDFGLSHNANYKQYNSGLRDAITLLKQTFEIE